MLFEDDEHFAIVHEKDEVQLIEVINVTNDNIQLLLKLNLKNFIFYITYTEY